MTLAVHWLCMWKCRCPNTAQGASVALEMSADRRPLYSVILSICWMKSIIFCAIIGYLCKGFYLVEVISLYNGCKYSNWHLFMNAGLTGFTRQHQQHWFPVLPPSIQVRSSLKIQIYLQNLLPGCLILCKWTKYNRSLVFECLRGWKQFNMHCLWHLVTQSVRRI